MSQTPQQSKNQQTQAQVAATQSKGKTIATKLNAQNTAAAETTSSLQSTGGSTGNGGAKRMVPCPTCKNSLGQDKQALNNQGGNKTTPNNAILPHSNTSIILEFLGTVSSLFGKKTVTLQEALEECPTCKNRGEVEDFTDSSQQEQRAKAKAEAMQREITELERQLGPPGGNRYTLVTGDEYLEVGLSINDPGKSYKVYEGKGFAPYGNEIKKGTVPVHGKANVVRGTNPLALPGGHYNIKCSNKFSVFTGAQGIAFESLGPITINGGITRITGPSVTVGTSVGQTLIEGGDINVTGNSIALTPAPGGSGQVACQGTFSAAGNITAAGGAHIDGDLSFTSATCPGKVVETETSSQTDQTTGPATWWPYCAIDGLKDFTRCAQEMILNPKLKAFCPRGVEDLASRIINLMKKSQGIELQPTGLVFGVMPGTAVLPIFNFPHHHKMEDMSHSHSMVGPNIRLMRGADGAQQVRDLAAAKTKPAPVPAQKQDEMSWWEKACKAFNLLLLITKIKP